MVKKCSNVVLPTTLLCKQFIVDMVISSLGYYYNGISSIKKAIKICKYRNITPQVFTVVQFCTRKITPVLSMLQKKKKKKKGKKRRKLRGKKRCQVMPEILFGPGL